MSRRAARAKPKPEPVDHELMLKAIDDGIHALDPAGRITFVNPAAARMLGWTPQTLLGRDQHATIHHTHADGRPYPVAECTILGAIREGRTDRRDDEVFWRRDGASMPVEHVTTPIRRRGRVIGAVVAFRARAHDERLTRELQRVFMQVPAAVCTTRGPEHVIETANLRYQQLVGAGDVIGRPARAALPGVVDRGLFDLMDEAFATGEPRVGHEVPITWDRRGDGTTEEGFVDVIHQPLRDASGRVAGLMIHAVDVTESTRARRGIEEHADDLQRATQSLARINRELDQFAYVASHDLKAPLRGIASLAHWIEEDISDRLGDESRKHLALLQTRVHRMEALIDGLLQYSRAGRVRNKIEPVDVRQLLTEVVEMLDAPTDARIEVADGMPAFTTERVPLQQVFLNLIGNALKHSGRTNTRVHVGVRAAGDFYEFSVADNGPGIARQFHERVWEVFQTLQPRDKIEGAGLGLALVKKNVEGRGGRVWIDAGETGGATFHWLWPKRIEQEG